MKTHQIVQKNKSSHQIIFYSCLSVNPMNTLETFRKEKLPGLQKALGVKNINAVPKLDKVIVAVGI